MNRTSHAHRFSRMSLPIVALFTILTLTVGMFLSLVFQQESLRRISHGFYGSEAVFFKYSSDLEVIWKPFERLLDVDEQTNYLVIITVADVRGVYLKGKPEIPPMMWGRFMTPEESAAELPVAVVGDGRWSEVSASGDIQTIDLLGTTYNVIGRMGTTHASSINTMVMVNMASVVHDQMLPGRIYVDGEDPDSVFAGLIRNAGDQGIRLPTKLAQPIEAVDVIAWETLWGWGYLVALIAVMVLSSAILLVEWIRHKIHFIAVLRLVGYDGRRICLHILLNYLALTLAGIVLALGIMEVLISLGLFEIKTTFVRQSLYVSGISLFAGLVITIPALVRAVRIDVVKILR